MAIAAAALPSTALAVRRVPVARVGRNKIAGRDALLAHMARARSWNAPLCGG